MYRRRSRNFLREAWSFVFLIIGVYCSSANRSMSGAFASASKLLSAPFRAIHQVVVVGGTHGNEYTGVWCIKALDANPDLYKKYSSLNISTMLGNPQAFLENKRFINTDLNREFSEAKLVQHSKSDLLESVRARELDQLLGPKFGANSDEDRKQHNTDLIVDLHSTTTNMGTTIIIPEGDAPMARAAAYVVLKCNQAGQKAQILMHATPQRATRPNLASVSKHGFTIEVGPVPQGVLRHDAVEKTQLAMAALFDYLQKQNTLSLRDKLLDQLKQAYPNGKVPCYLSAKAKRAGEMSGKLTWPSDPQNPNFPLYMLHKSLQDMDFSILRKGDPLYVKHDGSIIPYDGSHGDEVHVVFVNEGGYYYQSSGTGIGVAVKAEYDVESGTLLRNSGLLSETKL